jgi:cysteine synthase
MATWAVSYFASLLGMKSIVFYPQYKGGFRHEQVMQSKKWKEFGAEIIPIEKPNMQKVNFYVAKNILAQKYPDAVMLEQGLPFSETISEVERQVELLPKESLGGTLVVCIGSGVMASGIVKGLAKILNGKAQTVYGIVVAPKSVKKKKAEIEKRSGVDTSTNKFFSTNNIDLHVLDLGYKYEEPEMIDCPFPCNRYYDKKAFKWMVDNIDSIIQPVIFWNIGGDIS